MRFKRIVTLFLSISTIIMANAQNIFLKEFTTIHQMTPFDKIQKSYYEEAVEIGIKEAKAEIEAIADNTAKPTFENTILALENSGETLNRVLNVFYPLSSADADEQMQDIDVRITPKLSEFSTWVSLHEKLNDRIRAVYAQKDSLNLGAEERRLLQNRYDALARSGANLKGEAREQYRQLATKLSELTTRFGQNILKEQNTCEMWLTKDDLDGLPQNTIEAYAIAAKEKGREGEYLVTVAYPSYAPFMKYSVHRDLREKLYMIYNTRNQKGEFNNVPLMQEISQTRLQIANLLGYKTYADYSLEKTMAKTPTNVHNLLHQLKDAYLPAWKAEEAELVKFANTLEGKPLELKPWDYSYYSNKLKEQKYSISDEEVRKYFELNNVIKGVFSLATKLYGLHFTEDQNIIVYHPDVKGFNVTDDNGRFIGIIYTDFFPRKTKQSGAWMTSFREEKYDENGVRQAPHVSIVMNFTKPTETTPALLTFYEVETFLHEFGHALHGLLADTKYESMSGTSVYRDFVELPSQFNENFLTEKEFLDSFARDYKTGEPMPQVLVDRIIASARFGAAYSCLRQLSFGLVDMAWHSITTPVGDPAELERTAIAPVATIAPVEGTMVCPTFSHIFAGGYAAGYYSYKWSEVLDADAFAAFKEHGIFNAETARSFRENILSRGNTEDPMTLYKRFRGKEPSIDALLERDGIKKPIKGHDLKISKEHGAIDK